MTITILSAGITVIEDNGRYEYTSLGVPVSGAFDKLSYALACNLINEANAPVFEILRGPFQLLTDVAILLSVVGDAQVSIDGAVSSVNSVFVLESNKTLSVTPIIDAPVYLAIKGLLAPAVLGSASHDTLSNLGPLPLIDGQSFETLELDRNDFAIGSFISTLPKSVVSELRYVAGPHSIDVKGTWKVDSIARSGVRLSSPQPLQNTASALASFPVMPGAIQVPPSGLPVILGPDCGVTGGYPVAGVIIDADLHKLARLSTGTRISLMPVTKEQAAKASSALAKAITNAITRPSDLGSW
jgi:allophanate hydrolase subunit 2